MQQINTIMQKAREDFEKGRLEEASSSYLKALKLTEDNPLKAVIWAELSWLFYQQRNYQQALEATESILTYDPGYARKADLYRIRGYAYIGLNDTERGLDSLKKSVAIDRQSHQQQFALYEMMKIYFNEQKYGEAEKLISEIEGFFYQNYVDYWLSLMFYRGFVLYYSNRLDEAERVFEDLLENATDNQNKAAAMYGLAYVTFTRKDYLKTINLCETVIKFDPEFFDKESVAFMTAASFHFLGRDDIFEKYYIELVKSYPDGRYIEQLKKLRIPDAGKSEKHSKK